MSGGSPVVTVGSRNVTIKRIGGSGPSGPSGGSPHASSVDSSPVSVTRALEVSDPITSGTSKRARLQAKKPNNIFVGLDGGHDSDRDAEPQPHSATGTGVGASTASFRNTGARKVNVANLANLAVPNATTDDGLGSVKSKSTASSPGLGSERRARGSKVQTSGGDTDSMRARKKNDKLLSPRPSGQVGDLGDVQESVAPRLRDGTDEDVDAEFAQRFGRNRGSQMDDIPGLDTSDPLHFADHEFAVRHTDAVWNHYTSHQRPSGKDAKHLDVTGLTRLASDTVERFLQRFRSVVTRTNPKFTPEVVEQSMMGELPHTRIGGGLRDVETIKATVLAFLKKELDRDRDSKVGRTDFLMQWKPTVTLLNELPRLSKDICTIL